MDWRDKAACPTVDPELFFPVGNTGPAVDQIEKAKACSCARCTVTEICLQYALETGQDSGVWGGLSEDERRSKRRAARARRELTRADLRPGPDRGTASGSRSSPRYPNRRACASRSCR